MVARHIMFRQNLFKLGGPARAFFGCISAARSKAAAGFGIDRGGDLASQDGAPALLVNVGFGNCGKQRLGIGVERVLKQLVRSGLFNHVADIGKMAENSNLFTFIIMPCAVITLISNFKRKK